MPKIQNKRKIPPSAPPTASDKQPLDQELSGQNKSGEANYKPSPPTPPGFIKKELAFGGMALCLIFGLIVGSLVPDMLKEKSPSSVQPKVQTQAQPAMPQAPPVDQKRIAELEMACAKDPKNQDAWVKLADAYFDAHKVDEAIKAYETALTLGAPTADIVTDLGTMYRAKKDFAQARKLFQEAQKLDPKHLQSRLNEGVVLFFDLNQKEDALAVWKAALSINPNTVMPDGTPLSALIQELSK